MNIKQGVRVLGLRPEIVLALLVAESTFLLHGSDLVVTSAIEGTHSRASIHYTGGAVDLRRPLDPATAQAVARDLKADLGDDFDVVLEVDHIHVEFQPKAPY